MPEPSEIDPQLLRCPFCRGEADYVQLSSRYGFEHTVVCKQCGANIQFDDAVVPDMRARSARSQWNRRALLQPKPDWATLPRVPELLSVIRAYTEEVNRRAEAKMLQTGKLEGSHHAAMRQINHELGI